MTNWYGIYTLADCARLLREPRETVREWTTKGLSPSRALNQRKGPPSYDFGDLISLLVVSRLRQSGVPLQRIRRAERYLREEWGVDRPLATTRLFSAGKDILVRAPSSAGAHQPLIAASRYGQGAIEEVFASVLSEVRYRGGLAASWLPWTDVQVNPRRQFGAPCVGDTGIQTATLSEFVRAGDRPEYVAATYGVPVEWVYHAVEWEGRLSQPPLAQAA